ncbi:site-specific integrase [Roseomonas terrae]|uniref:Site-specific integrase n=1 Tax=Neoroseomonas terrae TaxID=424799 RepID=A0ABS5EPU7_9PROT|nr:site-specific integrase [Neoroseomonas terrae]MBR0653046.1 site-specific integrase [Neoroseomonas terrae]
MGKLTAVMVKALRHDPAKGKRPVRFGDGDGLYLQIAPGTNGDTKSWLLRFTLHGKAREMGLGPVGELPAGIPLAEARKRAAAARAILAAGHDPIEERQPGAREQQAQRKAAAEAGARTFRIVAAACIKAEEPGWKNKRTALLWTSSLENHAYPTLGDWPVAEIDRAKVREAIDAVWTSAPSIGRKVLRRIATVLRYAAAHGWRANDNPADAKMLRYAGLPPLPGGRKQPSLPWARTPAFLTALDKLDGASALALRFLILTALRSGEVRQARWSWVSIDGTPTLTVPGEVMKGKKSGEVQPHRVPLPPAALEVLVHAYAFATAGKATAAELPRLAALRGDALIFPSAKRGVPLSDMALSAVLRRMNSDRPKGRPAPWRDADGRDAVPHGFRATFSTWVDDICPEEREAAERALAHEIGNRVSGAYRRSDLFDRRTPLMAAWAEHCTRKPTIAASSVRSRRSAKAAT